MSKVYMTSDWHFGHKGVTRFRTQFKNTEEMEETILGNAMGMLNKRDVLYCLGDMAFTDESLAKIAQLRCKKILVADNHDTLRAYKYLSVFDDVKGAIKYKNFWLTHIPIHPQELFRGKNIHGHCHRGGPGDGDKADSNYYNAILEYNDYLPVSFSEIKDKLDG